MEMVTRLGWAKVESQLFIWGKNNNRQVMFITIALLTQKNVTIQLQTYFCLALYHSGAWFILLIQFSSDPFH